MARMLGTVAALLSVVLPAAAQDRHTAARLDVQHYTIDAEVNPRTQTLSARASVRFVPRDDTSTAVFELNNALSLARVEDERGAQIPAERSHNNFSVTVNFPQPLPKAQPATARFTYDGKLSGNEESPVFGIKFAQIQTNSGFLMYPARWFPVSGYGADAFTADLKITVPTGYRVVASGIESTQAAGDKTVYTFQFSKPSFPGSIAIVQGEPVRVNAEGVSTSFYLQTTPKESANEYGAEIGKVMAFLTSTFGMPPNANLTVVETDKGAPNGYSAPGILFLSPAGFGKQPNTRLLANQISRQWWGNMVAPATRAHLWLANGMARYAEMLYLEHVNGAGALETEARDVYIDALTMNDVPVIQTPRLEDYSPEYWAVTGSKGAAVLNMLRYTIGDNNFKTLVKEFANKYAWSEVTTEQFSEMAGKISGQNLGPFFLQWIESSGAPEFKLEYTTYRTQKGFRAMGKVTQDLDTFRMPIDLRIETEGNPEEKRVEVVGPSTEFVVDTFGKPKSVVIDPNNRVLRFSDPIRVAVSIRRGEQFAEVGDFNEALKEYQKALEVRRNSSLAHYRIGEVFFLQNNYQAAANEFREALNGDLEPQWTEVWAHLNLGKIFDITGQRERAVNEYTQAIRTKDNTQSAQEEAAKYLKEPFERKRAALQ
ncbi:MAG TPA: M1 family aminopeptidase [Bryobacteraceae bacterium]|nr:M1 family aminopeptidase [Bryobacteraceae bacterium]